MARKRVKSSRDFGSWEEINEALRHIAEINAAVSARVAVYNEEEAKRRKRVDDFCNPLRDKIEEIENGMQAFCIANRPDFGDKKSKELPNGRVDFRKSPPKVTKQKGFTWAVVLDFIRNSKYAKQFLRMKEELNKDAVLAYYAGTEGASEHLAEVYLRVEQDETFGYETYTAVEAQ